LAIAAARLGFQRVVALDCDPQAIRVAQENAARNGVGDQIEIRRQDLRRLPRRSTPRFSIICANLISDLLLAERDRILAQLVPGGTLLFAGMLESELGTLKAYYQAASTYL